MIGRVFVATSLALLITAVVAGPSASGARSDGSRTFAIAKSVRGGERSDESIRDAIHLARQAGTDGDYSAHRWSELEPAVGQFELDDVHRSLHVMHDVLGWRMFVGIALIDTVRREVPSDLDGVAWDSPVMKKRFHALVDALGPDLRERVDYLSIGNEVDVYLGANPAEFDSYRRFYEDALAYVHSVAPNVKVGVTVTFGGALGKDAARVKRLLRKSDVAILAYYPFDAGFQFANPHAPITDLPKMIAWASPKKLLLQEVGFSSAPMLGSSEEAQATFVRDFFAAWDQTGDAIPFASIFMLHDLPEKTCNELSRYYGLRSPAFDAYLCSIGLLRVDGTPKKAWDALLQLRHAEATR